MKAQSETSEVCYTDIQLPQQSFCSYRFASFYGWLAEMKIHFSDDEWCVKFQNILRYKMLG